MTDDPLIRASVIGTFVFAVVVAAAAIVPEVLAVPMVVLSLLLFAAGCVAFVSSLVQAAERSRAEAVTLGGVWWLTGCPTSVRRLLLGAFGVQAVVALTGASVRPFTALAFGILAPIYGLGLAALWGARHAPFPPRPPERSRGSAPRV